MKIVITAGPTREHLDPVRFDKPVTCKRIRIVAARGLDGTPRLTAEQIDLIK